MTNSEWLSGSLNLLMWLAPFGVSLIGLYLILFKPMISYLTERDTETVGAREQALQMNAEVDARIETLNAKLQVGKAEAGQLRAAARVKAAAKAQKVIDAARDEAESKLADAVRRIKVEHDTATQSLKQTAEVLSIDIAGQVLGRAIEA